MFQKYDDILGKNEMYFVCRMWLRYWVGHCFWLDLWSCPVFFLFSLVAVILLLNCYKQFICSNFMNEMLPSFPNVPTCFMKNFTLTDYFLFNLFVPWICACLGSFVFFLVLLCGWLFSGILYLFTNNQSWNRKLPSLCVSHLSWKLLFVVWLFFQSSCFSGCSREGKIEYLKRLVFQW